MYLFTQVGQVRTGNGATTWSTAAARTGRTVQACELRLPAKPAAVIRRQERRKPPSTSHSAILASDRPRPRHTWPSRRICDLLASRDHHFPVKSDQHVDPTVLRAPVGTVPSPTWHSWALPTLLLAVDAATDRDGRGLQTSAFVHRTSRSERRHHHDDICVPAACPLRLSYWRPLNVAPSRSL